MTWDWVIRTDQTLWHGESWYIFEIWLEFTIEVGMNLKKHQKLSFLAKGLFRKVIMTWNIATYSLEKSSSNSIFLIDKVKWWRLEDSTQPVICSTCCFLKNVNFNFKLFLLLPIECENHRKIVSRNTRYECFLEMFHILR